MQSIRKKLTGNYMAVALFTVLLLESVFMVVLSQYYLGGVERILNKNYILEDDTIGRF